ncbi:unnamed protein product, partial [Discosporangium mesarthrocarpum]
KTSNAPKVETPQQVSAMRGGEPVLYCVLSSTMERVPFSRAFHSACCYILIDPGSRTVFNWIGVRSSHLDRVYGERMANLIHKNDLTGWTLAP